MTNKLTDVKVEEISLVSRPAINRQFLIWKSMDSDTMVKAMSKVTEEVDEEEMQEHEEEETPEEEAIEEEAKAKAKGKGGKVAKEIVTETVSKEQIDELIQKALAEKDEKIAALEKAASDEKVRLTKEQEILKEELATERNVRINKEFVDLAKAEMADLTGTTPEALGPVLKEMKDKLSEEGYTAVYNVLKAASSYISENSKLDKELGTSASSSGSSALDKLNALTDGLIQKDSSMSRSKAFITVCEQNPGLYAEYNKDYKRGV